LDYQQWHQRTLAMSLNRLIDRQLDAQPAHDEPTVAARLIRRARSR
jgi:hypothetical protein